jgi:hypothetical protein
VDHLDCCPSTTELRIPLRGNPYLREAQQIEVIESMNVPDFLSHILKLSQGDPCTLITNNATSDGRIKCQRCSVHTMSDGIALLRLNDAKEIVLLRIPLAKRQSGMQALYT